MTAVTTTKPALKVAVSFDPGVTTARQNLLTALTWEGCEVLEVAPEQLGQRLPELGNCAALVYDLSPGTSGVPATIRECWLRFPDLPLLLYVPAAPHVGRLLTAIREVPTVAIEIQLQGSSESRRLQPTIHELVGNAVNASFRQILTEILASIPRSLRNLVEHQIHALEEGRQTLPLRVSSLASQVGVSLRRIEQVSRLARLPAPKDLLDHVTLLWLTFGARRRGLSTAKFAREVGVSTETLYRMRQRLIRPRSRMILHDTSAEFTTIFRQLVRSLHIPAGVGTRDVLVQRRDRFFFSSEPTGSQRSPGATRLT